MISLAPEGAFFINRGSPWSPTAGILLVAFPSTSVRIPADFRFRSTRPPTGPSKIPPASHRTWLLFLPFSMHVKDHLATPSGFSTIVPLRSSPLRARNLRHRYACLSVGYHAVGAVRSSLSRRIPLPDSTDISFEAEAYYIEFLPLESSPRPLLSCVFLCSPRLPGRLHQGSV